MRVLLNPSSIEDYAKFLRIKALPKYSFEGRVAVFPDEYAGIIGCGQYQAEDVEYTPSPFLFDYQGGVASIAIRKQKYAMFIDCGFGKTLIFAEFAKHAAKCIAAGQCVLWICPLMVVEQTMDEVRKFYGDSLPVEQVRSSELSEWLTTGTGKIGITNYDALSDETPQGRIGAMLLDESGCLKSHYGHWGTTCIRLGKGIRWKLCGTGTPAPNDRIEFANHAVFLDQFPTVNSFLARFFVNRGETQNRWELKAHALESFYRHLSHWCIFLTNPATYGWKDNTSTIPPIHVHQHNVSLTAEQRDKVMDSTGMLMVGQQLGGITSRGKLGQLAKGSYKGESISTNKPEFIRNLISTWPDESTIVWCIYNDEQATLEKVLPDAASMTGDTPIDERKRMITDFKSGKVKVLISKPKILGYGLNLQIATRQVFSGLQDSYESFYQAVKRSNRVGSTRPLNVHIPFTEIERPMIETVLEKAHRVQLDTEQQERIFHNASI